MSEYIGKRIIPRHDGEWDVNRTYEPLCLVLDENGDSYISRKEVPAGTQLSNENYWSLCSRFSEQVKLATDQMDAAVEGMKQENADTIQAVGKTCNETVAAVEKTSEENIAAVNKTCEDTVEAVNKTCEDTVKTVTAQTDNVVADTKQVQEDVNARMDAIEARQDENVAASTDSDNDYAAEVVDARVDTEGNAYASLGAAVRRFDPLVRTAAKVEITPRLTSFKGEAGNTSTGTAVSVMDGDRAAALDITLDYVECDATAHCIRAAGVVQADVFEERLAGKKFVWQIYSSADMEASIGYGFSKNYVRGKAVIVDTSFKKGLNVFTFDLSDAEFLALTKETEFFCLHILWGDYFTVSQPPAGHYEFSMSVYPEEDAARAVARAPYAVRAAHAELVERAMAADTADGAAHAQEADYSERAAYSHSSGSAGVAYIMEKIGQAIIRPAPDGFDAGTGYLNLTITKDTLIQGDSGFSIKIGTRASLTGKKLILYRDEAMPLKYIGFNAGNAWGSHTYSQVQNYFRQLSGDYSIADFDTLMDFTIKNVELVTEDFEGDIYLMLYGNTDWDMTVFDASGTDADGDGLDDDTGEEISDPPTELHNYYCIYSGNPDALIYSGDITGMQEDIGKLQESVKTLEEGEEADDNSAEALQEECTLLRQTCDSLTEKYENLQKGLEESAAALQGSNILWGKKYVACGDSFTQGDFSGWTDADGLSGKNSPVIYDSDWKLYKTYPWWIAKRNNMTLVNEALCGSIMALSKEYLADPESYAEGYRNPFSLKRYKEIPTDADYITLWFGINDSSHTNLGTIDDTDNTTFYGAWNAVLEYLVTNLPTAKIGIVITNSGSASYREAEREIAKKWGIPYLDMMGDDQVPVIFGRETSLALCSTANTLRKNAFKVSDTNGHPNLEAHKYQSTFIEAFLRRL